MLSTGKDSISLYMQIKDLLTARIGNGEWLPGAVIPSEIQLAQELGVSQGTVRKAITELVEKNVLTRKQGSGTFVSTHDHNRALFHFFHIADLDGRKVLPESRVLGCRRRKASRMEASRLDLATGTKVISIERTRNFDDKPVIIETVILPAELFHDLGRNGEYKLPNTLYELYEKQYGITIHSANERLRAVPASEHEASLLNVEPGSPLLEIERTALTLDNTPVELRISRCNSEQHRYENTIF
jgi:GntR family transcriptional regulator